MLYPERQPAPTPAADRLLAGAGFALQRFFARRLRAKYALSEQVLRHAENLRGTQLAEAIPALRYRVRRAGLTAQTIAECFGVYCAALAQSGEPRVAPETLGAARWLLAGGVAELAHAHQRMHAVALAAFARALYGSTVHLLTASVAAAQALAAAMQPVLGRLGLEAGCVGPASDAQARRKAYACQVTCAPMREAGLDYLRDRALSGGRPGALRGQLERLAAGPGAAQPLTLNGLHSALVLDADLAHVDLARVEALLALAPEQGDLPHADVQPQPLGKLPQPQVGQPGGGGGERPGLHLPVNHGQAAAAGGSGGDINPKFQFHGMPPATRRRQTRT